MVVRRPTIDCNALEFLIYLVRFEKTPTDYEPDKKQNCTAKNCKTAITRQACRPTKNVKQKTSFSCNNADNSKNAKTEILYRQKT